MISIPEAEVLVASVWRKSREGFVAEADVAASRSWEGADQASLEAMEEYFWGSSHRFAMLISVLSGHLSGGASVLDAGAGHGILAGGLKAAGFDSRATDLHNGLAIFSSLQIPYQRWHLEAQPAPFPDNSFDAVVLSQTIEHFTYSPLHPLREILRITKPGGMILIDAPNIACFRNVWRLMRGKSILWSYKRNYLEQAPDIENGVPYYDRHNHECSMQDLMDIADFFDLEVEQAGYYSSYNEKKRGHLAVLASRLRDCVRLWRKGVYALYRVPMERGVVG
ncbi:MAG: class I SAM-dependent methyltransferase [Mariprofundaceae bacterium]